MNLTQMGPALFALGLLALAGIVFALQRLRVRHREVVVVTTLFWREALEEQRARTLVERFRHPLTYLLILALASLLWFGAARPDSVRTEGERHVLLLDASAQMQREGRFAAATAALTEALESMPRDRTEVVLCGAHPRTLLAPGEDRALLGSRLVGVEAQPVAPSLDRALEAAAAELDDAPEGSEVVVFGDGLVLASSATQLPGTVALRRAPLEDETASNRGIVDLGLSPAQSGDWTRVDALVRVARSRGVEAPTLGVTIDGAPFDGVTRLEGSADARVDTYELNDLPAEGGTLELRLGGADDLALDDTLTHVLPDRPRIRVFVGDAPEPLRAVLELDPAVLLVDNESGADVVVGAPAAERPTLAFATFEDQAEAILVRGTADVAPDVALARAVGELGLDRVDGSALAEATGRTIALGVAPGDVRAVSLWSELLDPAVGFTDDRAFPVLVGRTVRWLADVDEIVPYAVPGRVVPTRVGAEHAALEFLSAGAGPGRGSALSVGLPAAGGTVASPASTADADAPDPGPWRPSTWVLLVALVLLGIEWVLFSRGRVA